MKQLKLLNLNKILLLVFLLGALFLFSSFSEPRKETNNIKTQLANIAQEDNFKVALEESYSKLLEKYKEDFKDAESHEKFHLAFDVGRHAHMLGFYDEAIKYLEEAKTLLPGLPNEPDIPQEEIDEHMRDVYIDLASAYMKRGEMGSCSLNDTLEHSLFLGGVANPLLSTQYIIEAEKNLKEYLEINNKDISTRWLLALLHMQQGGRAEELEALYNLPLKKFSQGASPVSFKNRAPEFGVSRNTIAGGVIMDDFNNDGRIDIISSSMDWDTNLFYFEQQQDGTFIDKTNKAGLTGQLGGLNLIQTDYNNDGFLDVFAPRGAWFGELGRHPNSLLKNNGDGTFTDVTIEAGLGDVNYPTVSAAWADYNNDGNLDVYVGNQAKIGVSKDLIAEIYNHGDTNQIGEAYPSQLFRNNGDGTFTDVAKEAGVLNERNTSGVTWGDYDKDGDSDIYLSNFGQENRLYKNNGDGTFIDVAPELGLENPIVSFPTWFWDYNNDGNLDIFVANYTFDVSKLIGGYLGIDSNFEPNRLYEGDGKGNFKDVTKKVGLYFPSAAMGANFGDIDNDGFLDIYLGNGTPENDGLIPNVLYRNIGGKKFEDVTVSSRLGYLERGHGISFADIDNDGDQDIYAQLGAAFPRDAYCDALLENKGSKNNWVTLILEGNKTNKRAIGAQLKLILDNGTTLYRQVGSDGSFGASSLQQEIGIGTAQAIDSILIYWPSGNTQILENVAINQVLRITEPK